MQAEISPLGGEQLQQLIRNVINAPADVRAKAKKAMDSALRMARVEPSKAPDRV
jgi:hypothetical protein